VTPLGNYFRLIVLQDMLDFWRTICLFGTDPSLAIPSRGFPCSWWGLIFLIAHEIIRKSSLLSMLHTFSICIYIISFSTQLYGQIHKDAYLIVGNLLILLVAEGVATEFKGNKAFFSAFCL